MFKEEKQKLIESWKQNKHFFDDKVINAFKKIPREDFMLEEYKSKSYDDEAYPTLDGQTISQPYTVMVMTNLLRLDKNHTVLEIGTGTGYQTAIIAEIIKPGLVYSFEIIESLHKLAKNNLSNYHNIKLYLGNFTNHIIEFKKFDRILITAACSEKPNMLIDLLKNNGILVAPIGTINEQVLCRYKKSKDKIIFERFGFYRFVPLKGIHGF